MVCKTYTLKIDKSHLSKRMQSDLRQLFLEAKWFTNYAIADGVFDVDYKTRTVKIKAGNEFQGRKITILSSQMRQAIVERLKQNIKALHTKKNNGYKVGKLKFKRFVHAVPLKQSGVTYRISGKNHIVIQNIPKKIRVQGLKQIPDGVEYGSALFIYHHGDYYIKIVTYKTITYKTITYAEPQPIQGEEKIKSIGIDLGIKNQMTFSNGVSIQYQISLTKRLRRLYQKLSRTQKGSNNRFKTQIKIQKEFYRLTCKKDDIKNKIVSHLKKHYDIVCFQDDAVQSWQRLWGSKILDTAIGGIKDILRERISTPMAVPPWISTTERCHRCGNIRNVSKDVYVCPICGLNIHRDVNAAINIEYEGLRQRLSQIINQIINQRINKGISQLPVEHREAALLRQLLRQGRKACGEESSTLSMLGCLNSIPHVKASLLYEPGSLTALARGSSPSTFRQKSLAHTRNPESPAF